MSGTGLNEGTAAQTAVSHVYGDEGRLIYRGYDIDDLAEHVTFEETCYLLWFGELPTGSQLAGLKRQLVDAAPVDPRVFAALTPAAGNAHPMALLLSGLASLALLDTEAASMDPAANQRKAIRLTAQTFTVTAGIARLRARETLVEPARDLALSENFLHMMSGERPDPLAARTLDRALILHADHGMNASTFAARVAAGTLADLHAAVIAALATLRGPLHGGANEQVMAMLEAIGTPGRAAAWVRAALTRGERIMGFGHRVYRTTDPRAPILKRMAEQLGREQGERNSWLAISDRIEETMRQEMEQRGKKVYPNVDFFSASVYGTLGIPADLFPTIFACARMPGWTAHIMEQYADNRLIRPLSEYIGPPEREVVPLQDRV